MYNILHLEQSSFIKKIVNNMLTEKGFNYISVDTAEEVYDLIKKGQYDFSVIITSMLIPDDTIENFIKILNNSKAKDIPVFVITSNDIAEDKKRLLNLGVSDYITKENLMDELLKYIELILKEDELMQDLKECNIAVVDDSKFDLSIVEELLNKHHIKNVDYYRSGKDILSSNKSYDIYLIDIVLEGEFGKHLILNLRKNNMDASIIIMSSLTNTKTLSSILNSGANDYIRKPIQEDLFIAKLKSNIRIYNLLKKQNQ